ARDHAVVGVGAGAHYCTRRDHAVAAQVDAGEDHGVRADPGSGADADRGFGGPLVADGGVGVGVAVVLVGDVDVGAGEDVVFEHDGAVRYDVRAATDRAPVTDGEERFGSEVESGHVSGAEGDVRPDQGVGAEGDPGFPEDGGGGKGDGGAFTVGGEARGGT